MRNYFPKHTSGAPLHTLSKLYDVSFDFVSSHSFEAVYCYICGRQRVAVARYRIICLVLEAGQGQGEDKYECSIINSSEDMSQVKVFVTDRQTDEWVLMPSLTRKAGDNKIDPVHIEKFHILWWTPCRFF